MHRLLEQQRAFHSAVTASSAAVELVKSEIGLAVYRNNWREGTRKALAADYPVVAELVGESCFRVLAQRYVIDHPSDSGDLQDFGLAFPTFLGTQYLNTQHAYLADVARLERALADSLVAAEAVGLSIDALRAIDPTRYSGLRFILHPCARIVASSFPIFDIWRAHHAPSVATPIDLASGAQQLLVYRPDFDALIASLTAADSTFVQAVLSGAALAEACERAFVCDETFNTAAAISDLFERRLVTALHCPI